MTSQKDKDLIEVYRNAEIICDYGNSYSDETSPIENLIRIFDEQCVEMNKLKSLKDTATKFVDRQRPWICDLAGMLPHSYRCERCGPCFALQFHSILNQLKENE